jgi:FG-GAP-like repeat
VPLSPATGCPLLATFLITVLGCGEGGSSADASAGHGGSAGGAVGRGGASGSGDATAGASGGGGAVGRGGASGSGGAAGEGGRGGASGGATAGASGGGGAVGRGGASGSGGATAGASGGGGAVGRGGASGSGGATAGASGGGAAGSGMGAAGAAGTSGAAGAGAGGASGAAGTTGAGGTDAGTSCQKTVFPVGHLAEAVALLDINGDGRLDLLVPEAGFTNPRMSVALGDGAGSFGGPTVLNATSLMESLAVGDFDGDGQVDVAGLSYYGPLLLYRGLGNGQLAAAVVAHTFGGRAHGIVVNDFNGDGRPDIAVAASEPGRIDVLLGQAGGTFSTPVVHAIGMLQTPYTIIGGDFNEDRQPDLMIRTATNTSTTAMRLLGQGNGSFSAQSIFSLINPTGIAVGDVNKDGHLDLVAAFNDNFLTVQLGVGDATFSSVTGLRPDTKGQSRSPTIADVTGDTIPDILTSNGSPSGLSSLSILRGRGDGTFGDGVVMPFFNPGTLVTGDLNRDGIADMVAADQGGAAIYLGPCP